MTENDIPIIETTCPRCGHISHHIKNASKTNFVCKKCHAYIKNPDYQMKRRSSEDVLNLIPQIQALLNETPKIPIKKMADQLHMKRQNLDRLIKDHKLKRTKISGE